MVPQRDRAFSWDVAFENGLHGADNPAGHDLNNHLSSYPPSSNAVGGANGIPLSDPDLLPLHGAGDSSKLTIKVSKAFPSSLKSTSASGSSSMIKPKSNIIVKEESYDHTTPAVSHKVDSVEHLDNEQILIHSDDDEQDDSLFIHDPLLLSIPPDLLMDQGGTGITSHTSTGNGRKSKRGGMPLVKEEKGTPAKKMSKNSSSSMLSALTGNNNSNNGSNNNNSGGNNPTFISSEAYLNVLKVNGNNGFGKFFLFSLSLP
jgi:hypothetical protein